MSIREMLLALPPKVETVEGCGDLGTVYLRVMGGAERAEWQRITYLNGDKCDTSNCFARLLVFCLCEPDGTRSFTDKEAELLGSKDGVILEMLFWRARKLNRLDAGALDAAKKD